MLHVLSDPFCLHSPLVIKEICLIEPRVDYYGPCLISWNCAVYNVHLILNCDKIIIHYRLSNTMFYPFSSLIFFKTVNCCMFWKKPLNFWSAIFDDEQFRNFARQQNLQLFKPNEHIRVEKYKLRLRPNQSYSVAKLENNTVCISFIKHQTISMHLK